MKKADYRTEFEEDRKEINLSDGDESGRLPSRSDLHRKGRKPKRKSGPRLINVILGVFTLIPVLIFVYVFSDFYKPGDNPSAKESDAGLQYEEKIAGATNPIDTDEEPEVEDKESTSEPSGTTEPQNNAADPDDEQQTESQAGVKADPKTETKPEKKPVQNGPMKTHVVADNETLFRISMKYFNSGAGVIKIKEANGLTSDNIMAGQTLVIPQ
jgi:LysM repeat protein